MKNSIIEYYDYLMQLAVSKCSSRTDAEDLVGDTMLAAFTYMSNGKSIEHPKAWLATTLLHKHNDRLRRKYRTPVTVCLEEGLGVAEEEKEYLSTDEAAKVRKELNHLAYITREVIVRHYYGNQSVEDIAKGLCIPTGTVKSRLYAGRNQMKKGLEAMEHKENRLPSKLYLSIHGSTWLEGSPMSLTDGDLIAQNILIIAYEKPLSISELSRAIGIPAAYLEPIVNKLIDGELMVKTENGKLYTDFIITKPQDKIASFKPQLEFVKKHFDTVWSIITKMSEDISRLPFVQSMTDTEKTILERYAVLKALQDFQLLGIRSIKIPDPPKRKNGGKWFAQALAIEAGYNEAEYYEYRNYEVHGGHRTTGPIWINGTKKLVFCEFDTSLWDNPHRFGDKHDLYFKHIGALLWHIYEETALEGSDIPNEFISCMPQLEAAGLIGYSEAKPYVKIPIINKGDYDKLLALVKTATAELSAAIGDKYVGFITTMKTPIPKHLSSVPELFKHLNASAYFVMANVREAYERGLHLKDVNYCCPPVVLFYENE